MPDPGLLTDILMQLRGAARPRPDLNAGQPYTYMGRVQDAAQPAVPLQEIMARMPVNELESGGRALTAPADLGALLGMGKALQAGIAFHGSPHTFDKFDASKIGTGEGSTAYGHGLYFAENNNVAKSYGGQTYKVDIPDEHIGKMLDWDKSLSEQPENVRNALEPFMDPYAKVYAKTAGDVYRRASQMGGQEKLSQALSSAGVPGIKYLDQGSRDAGKGTRNFVLFDPKHIKSTERITGEY
jgi:hypothetical protein